MRHVLKLYRRWLNWKAIRGRRKLEGLFGENFPAVFFRHL